MMSTSIETLQRASNYCFPFTGKFKVTSPFGRRSLQETWASKNHKGVDLVALENKTIVSVTSGVVKRAQFQKDTETMFGLLMKMQRLYIRPHG